MKKFEYISVKLTKTEFFQEFTQNNVTPSILNIYGEDGWELVNVYEYTSQTFVVTFKREK